MIIALPPPSCLIRPIANEACSSQVKTELPGKPGRRSIRASTNAPIPKTVVACSANSCRQGKDNESDKEYFVHQTGLIDRIKEDDEVTFELTEGKKGLNAVNVKLV